MLANSSIETGHHQERNVKRKRLQTKIECQGEHRQTADKTILED